MSFFNDELQSLENELKTNAKNELDQKDGMEELRKHSIARILRTFDLYIEAAKEYVASAHRFGITAKSHEYIVGRTFFTDRPKYAYSEPVFDIGLKNHHSYCKGNFDEICILPSGEVYVETSQNCWKEFSQEHRQLLISDIEKRSHVKETFRFNTEESPDIIDTLRLLTYNHSGERYDFDGGNWSVIYLDKPKDEEKIREEIKQRFLGMIRKNQSLSK